MSLLLVLVQQVTSSNVPSLQSGLAAANFLHSICPDNYLVLEARDRIGELFKRQELLIPGGRVHTDYSWAKIPIELGGEFIHGDAAVTHALGGNS
jgi:hypothetical protein